MYFNRFIFVFIILLLVLSCLSQIILSKEKVTKELSVDEINQNLHPGEVTELEHQGNKFVAVYTKQTLLKQRGSILLLHDLMGTPITDKIIYPLSTQLVNYGWNTLAIQLPNTNFTQQNKEEAKEYFKSTIGRISAAINFLKQKNPKNIFILGHGYHAHSVLNYITAATEETRGFKLILVGISSNMIAGHPENSIEQLKLIQREILDIYGSEDRFSVTQTASQRKIAAQEAGNKNYTQRKIIPSDRNFTHQQEILLKRIHSWMMSRI